MIAIINCRRFCRWLLCIFFFIDATAQPACKIEHYSTEDGLSHDIVTSMFKDREGFMWIGTWNGINRFDGHDFVSFKSSPGDLSHLKNDRVDQILEDDFYHLWIKAYDGQIYRFDKRTEQFLPLTDVLKKPFNNQGVYYKAILSAGKGRVWLQTQNNGLLMLSEPQLDSSKYYTYAAGAANDFSLPSNAIHFFKEDKTGKIWVGTQQGLACLVQDKTGIYRNTNNTKACAGCNVTTVAEGEGKIFFGTEDGRIFSYDNKAKNFASIQTARSKINGLLAARNGAALYVTTNDGRLYIIDTKNYHTGTFLYEGGSSLSGIYEDLSGNLWIKPEKEGVIKFDVCTSRFKTFRQKNNASYNYHGDYFNVYEDNVGVLWVVMKGGGFGYYDPAKDAIEYFHDEPNTPTRLFSNIVTAMYYDPAGILWLRTDERGVEKITFQRNQFHQQLLVNPGAFQSDNEVRGLLQDRKKRLWAGVKGGRLYVLQNGQKIEQLFVNRPLKGLVYTILQDSKGAIWMGTKANGLYKAVPINKEETKYKLYHYLHNDADTGSISSNEIYSLLEDKAGRIWIGSFENGLNMIEPGQGDDRPVFIHDSHALRNYPAGGFRKIRHMALDRVGNLWLATTEGLLIVNTGNAQQFSFAGYRKIPGDINSLGNNDVQFIYRDAGNQMWLATSGGGLNKAIGNNPMKGLQFKVYTTRHGLPNDYLLSCAEDNDHNLWIATQAGLAKLDPERKHFRNYNSYDGVPAFAFSEGSGIRMQDGKLVFGTIKGLLSFDPVTIVNHPMPTNMAFTGLQINNADAKAGDKNGILQFTANHTNALTLRYDQNNISFNYVVLDYQSNGKQQYAYRLQGFDTGWHNNMTGNKATYTNLQPGDYVFEVKCMNTDQYSNIPLKSMRITILPPPWKTWWAYTIYIIVAVIAFVIIRRTSLTMLGLRQKIALEKKLAELKLNFFTNVSHELRTPITLIINPVEEILKQEPLSDRGRQYLEVVQKNAGRMNRFVNQLLELRKLQSGKASLSLSQVEVVPFVQNIAGYFTGLAIEKNIRLTVNGECNDMYALIDIDKIETVIYNLLGNAFKFTPNGKSISINIKKAVAQDNIILEVSDEGTGVPPAMLDKIFELFYEGENDHGKKSAGTGIGLALSKELTLLHGGIMTATNNNRGGLTVHVSLPIGKQHGNRPEVFFYNEPAKRVAAKNATIATKQYEKDPDKPLVLLVEDNPDLQFFLSTQLMSYYRVEVAGNGEEGWQKAQELAPDLVLSDIMMPVMDGIQLLDKIKNDINTSHIPVVLLSARYSIESRMEGLRYGADYYITKPFNTEFLLASIDNLLRQRRKLFDALVRKKQPREFGLTLPVVTSKDENFLKEVIRIVEERMDDTEFNIDTVAESMRMSRTTFYKKFKSLTNLAPVEFVRDLRLQRARQYLDAGGNNISEVAYLVGFNNPKYFSTCFREKYRVSPSDYLKTKTL